MESDDKRLAEAAMLAGEIMLVSGAEIARIEETIHYILSVADREAQTMVFSTGIFVTLQGAGEEPITLVRRVTARSTNLNRICQVNEVSRRFCAGQMDLQEALGRLKEIKGTNQYSLASKGVSYILVALAFGVVMGGGPWECLAAAVVGGVLGLVVCTSSRLGLPDFCVNALGAFSCGMTALLLSRFVLPQISRDVVIISSIMPLVPGVIFTTAVRDTLNGDYSSGAARMLEAVVVALAVAAGVGASMAMFRYLTGGGAAW